jgi:hypothetical protein
MQTLIAYRNENLPLPRFTKGIKGIKGVKNIDWKNEYDILARRLGGSKVIKHFIISNGKQYILKNNVHLNDHSSLWAKAQSPYVESAKAPQSRMDQDEDVGDDDTNDSNDD